MLKEYNTCSKHDDGLVSKKSRCDGTMRATATTIMHQKFWLLLVALTIFVSFNSLLVALQCSAGTLDGATPQKILERSKFQYHRLNSVAGTGEQTGSQNVKRLIQESMNETYRRIAYVTYAHLKSSSRFEDLIFPSLDLWVPPDEPYFIVLSQLWKSRYEELTASNANFRKYKARIQPIYVDCIEGKSPRVECCKQELGILHMIENYDYDWLIYLDDDNFIRSTHLRTFLTGISINDLLVLTSGPSSRMLGKFGFIPDRAPYKCSHDPSYSFPWGQVVAYNRATLQLIRKGLELHGLSKQCLEYNVFHDVGNALFHWMYQLPELHLQISDRPYELRPDLLGTHGVGRCGYFSCSMQDIAILFRHPLFDPPNPFPMVWRNTTTGYRTTSTYQNYGDPSQWIEIWHTMPTTDCLGPNPKTP